MVVVSDSPYSEICLDGYCAPSFLEFEGAKEVGVEFHSLSKSYNCCGWRTGMLVGNKEVVAGMAKIKSHADRGMYYPLQVAATKALNGPVDFMEERNEAFQERRDVVVKGLRAVGLEVESSQGDLLRLVDRPERLHLQRLLFQGSGRGERLDDPGVDVRQTRRGIPAHRPDPSGRPPGRGDGAIEEIHVMNRPIMFFPIACVFLLMDGSFMPLVSYGILSDKTSENDDRSRISMEAR